MRGIEPATGKPVEGDAARLELIFRHLRNILAANDSAPDRVLSTRVYVTDMVRLRPMVNTAFERFFGEARPTRTIVQVSALNQGDTIEVEVIAACGRGSRT